MAIIDLGQTLTGTFNSTTPFNGTSYYTDYDLPTLVSLNQIRVTFNPNGINTPGTTNIDLINATTGAILSKNSASGYTGSTSVGLVDETIYPGITYKLRVYNTKLASGNYSLSLETLGQATSIVSRGFFGSNGSYGYQIGTLNATGGYAPLASAYDTVADVALSPSGLLYGISPSVSTYTADRLYVIDPSLGVDYINISANSVRNLKDPNGSILLQSLKSLAFSSDNKLYAIGTSATGTGSFYQIDLNTKVATSLATLPAGFKNSGDLVYDAANNRFLASSTDTGVSDALWQIPLANPAGATKLGQIGFLNVRGLAVEDDRIIGYAPATGTNSGTDKITINANTGVGTFAQNLPNYSDINGAATIVPLTVPVRNDFNGDGKSDLLWRNTDGSLALWQMNGSTATPSSIGALPAGWTTAGTGDFNGDGKADMLLSNANGSVATWQMNGSKVSKGNIIGTLGAGWSISGTGDFNGDGTNDVLMTNTNGTVAEWQINNGTVTESKTIGKLTNGWSIAGTADFNGDGKADILLKNTNGSIAQWQMDGGAVLAASIISAVTPDWKIGGTGDFNGDGKADILFRNNNGSVAQWLMNGSTVGSTSTVATATTDWKIAGTGDFNGDGKADILWRNNLGNVATWQMNGSTVLAASSSSIPTADPSWSIAAPIL
jgi:FG-GAP-like repeat